MSEYRIAIVREDGYGVRLLPGSAGERDLTEALTAAIAEKLTLPKIVDAVMARGVGVLKTERQVRAALEQAIAEVGGPRLRQAISDGVRQVLYDLKSEVKP